MSQSIRMVEVLVHWCNFGRIFGAKIKIRTKKEQKCHKVSGWLKSWFTGAISVILGAKIKIRTKKEKKCHKVSFRSDVIQICAMSSWEKLPRANAGSVAEDDVACCLALLVLGLKPNCISEGDYYLLVGTNARASHGCRAPTSFKYRLSKQVWVIFREFMQS